MSSTRVDRFVVVVVVLAGLASGCGSDGASDPTASADEQAVCRALQGVADELAAGRGMDALAGLDALRSAVDGTANEALQAGGTQFLDAISRPVDVGSLTVEESVALGDEVLAEGGAGLEAMGRECERLGEPVEVVATTPDDPAP